MGGSHLTGELGPETAAGFAAERATIVARSMLLRQTALEVARTAAAAGVPIALLKFAALDAGGFLLEGSRPAGDVDVLVPKGRARELATLLRGRGFAQLDAPGYEHHLPALLGPHGVVEIHRVVLGVRLGAGRASATFEQLEAAGLLRSVPLPADPTVISSIPATPILMAHALAHGLGQHGFSPRAYPLTTLFADLQDLGFGTGEAMPAAAARWLRHAVPAAEIEAAGELVEALATGDHPLGDARILLDHLLAGVFDSDYRAALKVRQFRYPLSDRAPIAARLSGVWAALRDGGRRAPTAEGTPRTPHRLLRLLREGSRGLRGVPRGRQDGAENPPERL